MIIILIKAISINIEIKLLIYDIWMAVEQWTLKTNLNTTKFTGH